jgi:Putative peptidoglycan binding domain
MNRVISLLIGCSLALAGLAIAQQPEQQSTPTKKKQGAGEKTHAAQAQPGATAARPQGKPARERGATNEPRTGKGRGAGATEQASPAQGTNVSGQPSGAKQAEQQRKGKRGRAATTTASPAATAAGPASTKAGQATAGAGGKKKLEQQQVQQIKSQHANFRAQPKPQQVPAVTFNQNHRIQGSERWTGPQYEVFRSYRPEWHDEGWYRSHYTRVELIGGGYYYFNNGYWFPAWGFSPSAQYYAYDGPIYVGHRAEPPDQVIADVQASLQQMGYYRGEVDGLVGPLTREALTAYQADNGLTQTAAIDEPTLDSLGMS